MGLGVFSSQNGLVNGESIRGRSDGTMLYCYDLCPHLRRLYLIDVPYSLLFLNFTRNLHGYQTQRTKNDDLLLILRKSCQRYKLGFVWSIIHLPLIYTSRLGLPLWTTKNP